jgi:hypothetical protein
LSRYAITPLSPAFQHAIDGPAAAIDSLADIIDVPLQPYAATPLLPPPLSCRRFSPLPLPAAADSSFFRFFDIAFQHFSAAAAARLILRHRYAISFFSFRQRGCAYATPAAIRRFSFSAAGFSFAAFLSFSRWIFLSFAACRCRR